LTAFSVVLVLALACLQIAQAGDKRVTVTVKGESWDSDSYGFAYFQALSAPEGRKKAGRPGSRISVDGQPGAFAIAGPGPEFELTLETSEQTFRLIVEGDRYPRTITQPFTVPEGGGEMDVGRIETPRAEGNEHTWPLPMSAKKLGYSSTYEMMNDNNALIRMEILGSGTEGAPDLANNTKISIKDVNTNSFPFTMDKQNTFFQTVDDNLGAFIVVIKFNDGEPDDKKIVLEITDIVSQPEWDPPRPWYFDPLTVWIRRGFATELRPFPKID